MVRHTVSALRLAVVDLWQEQERARHRVRHTDGPLHVDLRASVVLLTAVAVILAIRYAGLSSQSGWVVDLLDAVGLDALAARLDAAWTTSPDRAFNLRVYWAVFRIVAYTLPVILIGRWVLGRRVRDLGGATDWRWAHARPYVVMYLLMLPLVLAASTLGEFQEQYPLYDPGGDLWPRFVIWEALYLGQFLALELFFRGFLVHGLAPRFGLMAVPVMVVPYVAIHLTKPLPEAIGSIVAGLVLGFFSLRTGVVWWGALLHFGVALTIDLAVL